jgi:hypothetical protein
MQVATAASPSAAKRRRYTVAIAERAAGLPKLTYGRWRPYRRQWATERKHLALKDVEAAGRLEGRKHVAQVLSAAGSRNTARGGDSSAQTA